MTLGVKVDRAALHRVLWRRTDRRRTLKIHQGMFGEELGISPWHLSRLLKELEDAGRVRKLTTDRHYVGTYVVYDPADFTDEPGPTRAQ
jgi:DNA-binding MarR family transcriptional regulator